MTGTVEAKAGALETPEDAGLGPAGVVKRWLMELDLSDKTEETWRKKAKDVQNRYRDEMENVLAGGTYTIDSGRYSQSNRFNILYSNVQTICPALFNQSPNPDVRRRYRDADPVGKQIAEVLERGLSFTMDDQDFDRYMRMAVKDQQLVGRGLTRVCYEPFFSDENDTDDEQYQEKKYEEIEYEHVNWGDFRHGPARIWEECEWIAFRHLFTMEDGKEEFGAAFDDVELDYSPKGINGDEGDVVADTFKRAEVWEIWDKEAKEVLFIAPSLKERPLKTDSDPLGLANFYPVPRPLYATENTDSMVPVEPFRFYRDQADELDEITKRIAGVVRACKARGIYDSTINEMANLMDAGENIMIPAGDVLPLMSQGGLEKAIWMFPIEKIAVVLGYLYTQREAVKTSIYEITGIADIMRGSSSASETLGAQQLKAQFGTMRLDDMRREVQRYARDLVCMTGELIAEKFSPDTMEIMTDLKLPSAEQKQALMMQAQQLQMAQQEIPEELQEQLDKPTWDDALQVLRDDRQRSYRVDIETDTTVAGDQAQEQKNITELMTGISTFIQNAGPAVAAGYLPLEAAKSLLMTAVRRFKLGRNVEDALDMIGEDKEGGKGKQPDPAVQQMQHAMQDLQGQAQQLQKENEVLKANREGEQQRLAFDQSKAQAEAGIKQGDQALKAQDLQLRASEPKVTPQEQWQYDEMMAREKMAFDAGEADKDRQLELAKALIAQSDPNNPTDQNTAMNEAAMMMQEITDKLTAPRMIIRDDAGNVIGSESVGCNDG